jgi:MFS superfamily sulfate permease-like transporter
MSAWIDLGLMALTFFLSIFYNVEVGIIVSLIVSLFLVVHRSSKTRMNILVRVHPAPRHPFLNLAFIGPCSWD